MQACGTKYQLKADKLDETNVDDVVVALVNYARKVSSLYYFLMALSQMVFCYCQCYIYLWFPESVAISS